MGTQLRWAFATRWTAALALSTVCSVPALASTDGVWRTPAPIFAHAHSAAIYDPIRYRVLSFGGIGATYLSSVSELRLSGSGIWNEIPAVGPGPVARAYASAIYDPTRDRMVVFGGSNEASEDLNDVWVLSLDNATWTRLEPSGQAPDPRDGHTAIYDSTSDRMIVYGGYESGVAVSDVWALSFSDPPTWTRIDAGSHAPLPRYFHTAIYDPARDRMVVFGGLTPTGPFLNDMWALSLGEAPSWTRLDSTASKAPYRWDHSAVYDPTNDRMIVFGGGNNATYLNDVWSYSFSGTSGWQKWSAGASLPPPRHGQSAVLDPVAARLIVTGGEGDYTGPLSDSWSLMLSDPPGWGQLSPPQAGPPARYGQASAYDPIQDQMLIFGGQGTLGLNDTWALSLGADPRWRSLASSGTPPPAIVYRPAIFDPVRDRMILDEGYDGAWALPLGSAQSWSHLISGESLPSSAWGAAAIYDPVRDRMLVFGGEDGSANPSNSLWAFDLSGAPWWTQLSPGGAQAPSLVYPSAIYDPRRDRVILYGGDTGNTSIGDVWALSFSPTLSWEQLSPAGPIPLAREGHTAVYDSLRDRMVVFGGSSLVDYSTPNDVWALSLSDPPTWSQLNPEGPAPGGRWLHTSVYCPKNDYMVMFGGQGRGGQLGDLWFLDWKDRTQVSALGAGVSTDGVHLLWQETSVGASIPVLHRQQDGGSWVTLGSLSPQPNGRILYTDTAISPGVQYDYGISVDSVDAQSFEGEIAVRVPSSLPTPALLSLLDAHADSGFVTLEWYAGDPSVSSWELDRRTKEDSWGAIGQLSPGGDHVLRYEDRSVVAGTRYGYRMGYQSGGRLFDSPEVWISVPLQSSFGIRGARPNPAVGALTVSFSLKGFAPARLELLDVTGRIRMSRELGALGPGDYDLPIQESVSLPAGLYVVRLTQGSQTATSKVSLVR